MEKGPYKVNYLEDTNEIINAVLDGYKEFVLNTDDVNSVLQKNGIGENSKELLELLSKGTMKDWFDAADNGNAQVKIFLEKFLDKMSVLKEKNKNLYVSIIKILINKDFSNEDAMKFEFPKIKNSDATFE